jgi:hypothetical protein
MAASDVPRLAGSCCRIIHQGSAQHSIAVHKPVSAPCFNSTDMCADTMPATMPPLFMCTRCMCRSLPVTVEPAAGRLQAAGNPDSSSPVTVTFSPTEPGAAVGELAISIAGAKEPLICPLGAAVVQSSYQLIDDVTKSPVTEVGVRATTTCGCSSSFSRRWCTSRCQEATAITAQLRTAGPSMLDVHNSSCNMRQVQLLLCVEVPFTRLPCRSQQMHTMA